MFSCFLWKWTRFPGLSVYSFLIPGVFESICGKVWIEVAKVVQTSSQVPQTIVLWTLVCKARRSAENGVKNEQIPSLLPI